MLEAEDRQPAGAEVEGEAGAVAADKICKNKSRSQWPTAAALGISRLILSKRRRDEPTGSRRRYPSLTMIIYLI